MNLHRIIPQTETYTLLYEERIKEFQITKQFFNLSIIDTLDQIILCYRGLFWALQRLTAALPSTH